MLPLTVIYGDIDNLKKINDTHGHEKGDFLLKKAASILKDCIRDEDIIARIGGDEFCIVLLNTSGKDAINIIKRVSKRCKTESSKNISLNISFGIKTKDVTNKNLRTLLKEAEAEMYRNKLGKREKILV